MHIARSKLVCLVAFISVILLDVARNGTKELLSIVELSWRLLFGAILMLPIHVFQFRFMCFQET
jgi:hypothetical protein